MRECKNTKLNNIRNSIIRFSCNIEEDVKTINVYMNTCIEPAARPRQNNINHITYDPLASYKNHIRKKFNEWYNEDNIKDILILPLNSCFQCIIKYRCKPPKSDSMYERYIKIKEKLPYVKYPDNDNIEKTVYDTFNGLIYNDDKQLYSNITEKLYSDKDETIIQFNFLEYLDYNFIKNRYIMNDIKRLNKKQTDFIKSIYNND